MSYKLNNDYRKKIVNKSIVKISIVASIVLIITVLLGTNLTKVGDNPSNIEVSKIERIRMKMANSERYKTYYVSADGTSSDGTDINNPMSLNTANSKTYEGNERILLKRGDTFYGTLKLKAIDDNRNGTLYIGSYGSGEKPIISGANILTNPSEWQLVNNQIYRLNMANESSFIGIGYDYKNLGLFASVKDKSSSGKWGERTKNVICCCN